LLHGVAVPQIHTGNANGLQSKKNTLTNSKKFGQDFAFKSLGLRPKNQSKKKLRFFALLLLATLAAFKGKIFP